VDRSTGAGWKKTPRPGGGGGDGQRKKSSTKKRSDGQKGYPELTTQEKFYLKPAGGTRPGFFSRGTQAKQVTSERGGLGGAAETGTIPSPVGKMPPGEGRDAGTREGQGNRRVSKTTNFSTWSALLEEDHAKTSLGSGNQGGRTKSF